MLQITSHVQVLEAEPESPIDCGLWRPFRLRRRTAAGWGGVADGLEMASKVFITTGGQGDWSLAIKALDPRPVGERMDGGRCCEAGRYSAFNQWGGEDVRVTWSGTVWGGGPPEVQLSTSLIRSWDDPFGEADRINLFTWNHPDRFGLLSLLALFHNLVKTKQWRCLQEYTPASESHTPTSTRQQFDLGKPYGVLNIGLKIVIYLVGLWNFESVERTRIKIA